jgi:hypothetical protein
LANDEGNAGGKLVEGMLQHSSSCLVLPGSISFVASEALSSMATVSLENSCVLLLVITVLKNSFPS